MRDISVIGIDIAKNVFHICCMNKIGKVVLRKRVIRDMLMEELVQMPRCQVAMEACGGSNYWGRELSKLGFEVKLISPQFVKPYVKSNKNDQADAEAICEAAQRPTMRFCAVKSVDQQEIQHLHRIRERLIKNRVALSNEIRGILLEHGFILSQGSVGRKWLEKVREIIKQESDRLSKVTQSIVFDLLNEFVLLEERANDYENKIKAISSNHPVCKRLKTIPGVGPVIASAIVAAVNDPGDFKNGRQFAAWLGLVPRQHSTGGKPKLGGISKRGDKYIRKQLIHGSRSLLYRADIKTDSMSLWAYQLKQRRGWNRTCVAIANKNARIIWAVLRYEKDYSEQKIAA